MTTGIFVRIAAEAAEEARRAGARSVTPYWRVLKEGGKLNDKFPKGQAARLRREGHRIAGNRVRNFEAALQRAV